MPKVIDISISIKPNMITYPKNPEVQIETIKTGHSQISKIVMGTHTGTHIDFPSHVFEGGKTSSDFGAGHFFGPCKVLDLTSSQPAIIAKDLYQKDIQKDDIILAKTQNSLRDYAEFRDDYIYLDGSAAEYLTQKEIRIFGIDYLSVKKQGSEDNSSHTHLLSKDILIFEGINLKDVEEGNYTFVGIPLKIEDVDGNPARAVIINT